MTSGSNADTVLPMTSIMKPERPKLQPKGSLVAATTSENILELWFSSPTGDSSDSWIFNIPTQSKTQAETLAEHHKKVWGLN